jgi:ribosomal protein S18 acetylase RimI-like enzyme
MVEIQITRATIADLALIRDISIQTFTETFARVNTADNLALYLQEHLNETVLTKEIENIESDFFLAKANDTVIGYLKLNWGNAQTEIIESQALEIHRIYVLEKYHGKQVGQRLLDKAITVAKHKKAVFIWLGVWENNKKAQNFYSRNGFIAFDTHVFNLGNETQTDLLYKLDL